MDSSTEEDYSTEMRVIIRVCVTDIPGNPLARFLTLGDIFCKQYFHRPLNSIPNTKVYDGMVILDGFDSGKPVNRWFIYDINVKGPRSRQELVAEVPHRVFLARNDKGTWTFIPRDRWNEGSKSRCNMFTWGGRQEQERVAKMREQEKNAATDPPDENAATDPPDENATTDPPDENAAIGPPNDAIQGTE